MFPADSTTPSIGAVSCATTQLLMLRWQIHQAWWWIVLSTLGWTLGTMDILGVSLGGAAAGAATGMALEFLMRHPGPEFQDRREH